MTITLQLIDPPANAREIAANRAPDRCPRCEAYGTVKVLAAVQTGSVWHARRDAVAVCVCVVGEPVRQCLSPNMH